MIYTIDILVSPGSQAFGDADGNFYAANANLWLDNQGQFLSNGNVIIDAEGNINTAAGIAIDNLGQFYAATGTICIDGNQQFCDRTGIVRIDEFGNGIFAATSTGDFASTAISDIGGLISFFGAPNAGQQSGGSLSAGTLYNATAQAMINTMWAALRTFGLLS